MPSSSLADELCCGNGVLNFCHRSLILNIMPLVLPPFLHGYPLSLVLQRWSFFSLVLKNWKLVLPLLVEYFKMYLRPTSTCMSTALQHAALPSPLATVFHSLKKTSFCCHVGCTLLNSSLCAFSLLWCSSHRVLLTTKIHSDHLS